MDLQEARQSLGRIRPSAVLDQDYFPFAGGLNVVETPMQLAPGELLGVSNYECNTLGGYSRLQGYERYDGRALASQTPYYTMIFTAGTPLYYPPVGGTIFGATSGAQGVMLEAPALDAGGMTGYLVIWQAAGSKQFVAGEEMQYLGANFAQNSFGQTLGGAPTVPLDAQYTLDAQAYQRSLVQYVPGQGPVRGVVEYRNNIYAFRDAVGGLSVAMWKATTTGWVAVPPYPQLRFTAGSVPGGQINVGDVVVGGTSAASATVARVVLQSGSWDAGTAQGFLILSPGTYGFLNTEALKVGGVTEATAASVAAAPALLPGGSYEFRVKNFYGSSGTIRLYGVDGKNRGFEYQDNFNGQLPFYCPIESGMTVDAPTHLAAHRGRLWLAFPGGSAQPSGVNDPVGFSALNGAAELGAGQEIVGFLEEMNPSQSAFYSTATLFIFCANETYTITGDGPNWILGPFATETGANAGSVQRLGQGIFLSDRGFASLTAVAQLGNFALATFSQKIQTLIPSIVSRFSCSTVSRNKSLYRAFLNDGTFVSIGFKDTKVTGITTCDLGEPMTCAYAGEASDKTELLLLGGTNGYVYKMDSGNNIDGQQLNAYLFPAYHFSKTPSRFKRYRRAQLDVKTPAATSLTLSPNYSFGDQYQGADPPRTVQTITTAAMWDTSLWDFFTWDSSTTSAPTIKLEASGRSISLLISHSSTNDQPHVIQGLSLHKSMRRLDRGSQA